MNYDPFGTWTERRRIAWTLVAGVVVVIWGPRFVRSLRPQRTVILDFAKEWFSARNYARGMPIYTPQEIALRRHLGYARNPQEKFFDEYNTHPPTAVLLALPFGWLDYSNAFLAWNLVSLAALGIAMWWVVRELGLVFSPWSMIPVVALGLLCNPLRQQVNQGQLNLVLLWLITAVWVADRRGKAWLAGAALAGATAVKLFPGLLVMYFVLRRDWKTVLATAVSGAAIAAITAGVLGVDTITSYIRDVLPHLTPVTDWWGNISVAGFWAKLFNATSGHISPLWQNPALARAGTLLSIALILMVIGWSIWQARDRSECDLAFGLAVLGMVLASPLAWDHYLVLLMLPLVQVWIRLPKRLSWTVGFILVVLSLWVNQAMVWRIMIPGPGELHGTVASPLDTLTALSYQFYAMLWLLAMGVVLLARKGPNESKETTNENQ